jgi:hypothetical protein
MTTQALSPKNIADKKPHKPQKQSVDLKKGKENDSG